MAAKKDKLKSYREKRKLDQTPEPAGKVEGSGGTRFCVQKHHATRLHYDLRLEHEGVLLSWAVPKGPPTTPGVKRLAVRVEDHPVEYIDFEGEIADGNYGAGTVEVWDSGTYELLDYRKDKIRFHLHGERLQGVYYLYNFQGNNWFFWKKKAPA